MAAANVYNFYTRNNDWRSDEKLKLDMRKYVCQGIQRREMIDFLRKDFGQYTWSIPTLDRRLRHFDIYYTDVTVPVEAVRNIVEEELNGPGALLGYRALHKKIRQIHKLRVPRDLVYAVMSEVDPEGLESRAVTNRPKKVKGCFSSNGPNWVHSVDGHDKLMGFQNWTFPLAIYGCLDSCSRKILWLKIWTSNSDPKLIGAWYLQHLMETKRIPTFLRMDRGTETGIMATIHAFLHGNTEIDMPPEETVLYGPSTSNQIERWWKELHERLEKYFKQHLYQLKENAYYDPCNEQDRSILAFVMIPLLQRELDIFKNEIWNTHRIRAQKNTILPNGVPNHLYSFPEHYELEDCGWDVTDEQLEKVANLSGVMDLDDDFLSIELREKCERLIPPTEDIKPCECCDAYIFLKQNIP